MDSIFFSFFNKAFDLQETLSFCVDEQAAKIGSNLYAKS